MIQSNELESQEINHTSSSSNLTNIGWGAIENLGILESNEHHINDVTEIGDGIFAVVGYIIGTSWTTPDGTFYPTLFDSTQQTPYMGFILIINESGGVLFSDLFYDDSSNSGTPRVHFYCCS